MGSCLLDVLVQLEVPSNPRDYPKIAKIMMNLSKNDFKFDITWLSSHFHDIDEIWLQQSRIISNEIQKILSESFKEAINSNPIESWMELKYQDINNQIISAQKSRIQNK